MRHEPAISPFSYTLDHSGVSVFRDMADNAAVVGVGWFSLCRDTTVPVQGRRADYDSCAKKCRIVPQGVFGVSMLI